MNTKEEIEFDRRAKEYDNRETVKNVYDKTKRWMDHLKQERI